jgi:hypothetical protein
MVITTTAISMFLMFFFMFVLLFHSHGSGMKSAKAVYHKPDEKSVFSSNLHTECDMTEKD